MIFTTDIIVKKLCTISDNSDDDAMLAEFVIEANAQIETDLLPSFGSISESNITTDMRNAAAYYAAAKWYGYLKNWTTKDYWKGEYETAIKRILKSVEDPGTLIVRTRSYQSSPLSDE